MNEDYSLRIANKINRMKHTVRDVSPIVPGMLLVSWPVKRYQVRHYQSGRVMGWRNSIGGARRLAENYHRILDHHCPHADGTPQQTA